MTKGQEAMGSEPSDRVAMTSARASSATWGTRGDDVEWRVWEGRRRRIGRRTHGRGMRGEGDERRRETKTRGQGSGGEYRSWADSGVKGWEDVEGLWRVVKLA
ncbi:hypothetical protein F5148DRAFT_1149034 [Russula earlei]|uniref:Uncharacterized protein n=1 Tax=Russula earlei TaxID=71964 RepID=A0ACC0UBG7_9AGAM|nr:hypothetical protein F5148DRAFT_1149034 [Russula earlei]